MIIGVLSQKGGVGKTTVALNLAAAIATSGSRVLVVDANPARVARSAWSSAREADPLFPVVGMAKPTLHRELPNVAANYHFIVIDGAPRVNDLARSAILASDLMLNCGGAVALRHLGIVGTCLIREARQINAALEAAFLINRKIARSAIGGEQRRRWRSLKHSSAGGASQPTHPLRRKCGQGARGGRSRPTGQSGAGFRALAKLACGAKGRQAA